MSRPAVGPAGPRAGTTEISPMAKVALYALTTLLVAAAVEPGWTTVAMMWLALGSLTLALRGVEQQPSGLVLRLLAALPGAAVLIAMDVAANDASRSTRGLVAAGLVGAGLAIIRLAYPAGISGRAWVLLVGAAFHLAWLDWHAATIGLLAMFGSFGLFSAALLMRDRPLADESVPFSPFIYLGVLTGIALI
ncbi:MAG: hypothetical protein ACR2QE_12920 [Acidimicrobiales bacterium]